MQDGIWQWHGNCVERQHSRAMMVHTRTHDHHTMRDTGTDTPDQEPEAAPEREGTAQPQQLRRCGLRPTTHHCR